LPVQRRRGRRHEGACPDEGHCKKKTLATEAVTKGGGKWSKHRGGQQTDESGDPDSRSSAVLVSEHAECNKMRPFRSDRSAPREFHPPNVVVANSGTERGYRRG